MTLQYGNKARTLLEQLQRSDWLPAFNDMGLREVLGEFNELHQDVFDTIGTGALAQKDDAVVCGLAAQYESMRRNKRCALAYVRHRLETIKMLRWETGQVIPQDLRPSLGPREKQFFKDYNANLARYQRLLATH